MSDRNLNLSEGERGAVIVTTASGKKIHKSRYQTNQKWEELNTDSIKLRVPAGYKQVIKDYQNANKDRYKSVNAMIIALLEKEIGVKFECIKTDQNENVSKLNK